MGEDWREWRGEKKEEHTLSDFPHSAFRISISSKQQHGCGSTGLDDSPRLSLRQRGQPAEFSVCFFLAQFGHAVGELFDPCPMGFEVCSAFRKPVSHDGLFHQSLAKGLAFQAVFERSGEGNAGDAVYGNANCEAFVVEVLHDVFHALALNTDEIGDGHFDVVELDEGRSGSGLAADADAAHGYAFGVEEGDDEHAESRSTRSSCSDRHGCIVAPETVGDPISC